MSKSRHILAGVGNARLEELCYCNYMKKLSSLFLLVTLFTFSTAGAQAVRNNFTDVSNGAWYFNYVYDAADLGIVSGYQDAAGNNLDLFGPGDNVTLGQVLKIMVEAAGYNVNNYNKVIEDEANWIHPYYRVSIAEDFGIFVGAFEDIEQVANRSSVAMTLIDTFYPGGKLEIMQDTSYQNPFSDVHVQNTYQDGTFSWGANSFILKLAEDGIISGDTDSSGSPLGTFRPTEPINRAEVVKMALKAREVYGTPGVNRGNIGAQINHGDTTVVADISFDSCGTYEDYRDKDWYPREQQIDMPDGSVQKIPMDNNYFEACYSENGQMLVMLANVYAPQQSGQQEGNGILKYDFTTERIHFTEIVFEDVADHSNNLSDYWFASEFGKRVNDYIELQGVRALIPYLSLVG